MRLNFWAFCFSIVMALFTDMGAGAHPALQVLNYVWLFSVVVWGMNFLNSLIDRAKADVEKRENTQSDDYHATSLSLYI